MPVRDEGASIDLVLDRISQAVGIPYEILVVYDDPQDSTVPFLEARAREDDRVRPVINQLGRGPSNALRSGFAAATAPAIVVTMADLSDDLWQIEQLTHLVERGFAIAAASRFSPGGRQIGAPFMKHLLARTAGLTLHHFARVGTRDATNSFKAYSKAFIDATPLESSAGFEVALELVAKAKRRRLPIAEVPTIWLERTSGQSRFRILAWLPQYLRWYRLAMTPRWLGRRPGR